MPIPAHIVFTPVVRRAEGLGPVSASHRSAYTSSANQIAFTENAGLQMVPTTEASRRLRKALRRRPPHRKCWQENTIQRILRYRVAKFTKKERGTAFGSRMFLKATK